MFRQSKMILTCVGFLVFGCIASGFLITRAFNKAPRQINQIGTQQRSATSPRNLSLRPEALRVSRQLGKRFATSQLDSSLISGTLNVGKTQTTVSITRDQAYTGEAVEISLANEAGTLIWNNTDGAKSSIKALSDDQRLLIERLVFDSADYFVLAQLRGANYHTIARSVRSDQDSGSDDYSGPLWDIVRIDDPERDEQKKPRSSWRLFYINSNTGLIDKIVSEHRSELTEAVLSDWTTVAGERLPSRITWRTGNQTLMELSLTTFTVASR